MFKDTKRVAIIRQSEKHRLYNGQQCGQKDKQ